MSSNRNKLSIFMLTLEKVVSESFLGPKLLYGNIWDRQFIGIELNIIIFGKLRNLDTLVARKRCVNLNAKCFIKHETHEVGTILRILFLKNFSEMPLWKCFRDSRFDIMCIVTLDLRSCISNCSTSASQNTSDSLSWIRVDLVASDEMLHFSVLVVS